MSVIELRPRQTDRPESLRELLDRGEDIEAYYRRWSPEPDFVVSTGEQVVVDVWGRLLDFDVITPADPEGRQSVVVSHREMVDRTVGATGDDDFIGGEAGRRRLIIGFSWGAELLEDRALFERLLVVAPAEAVATYEREKAEVDAPAHPLRVERVADVRCDDCGETIVGAAITAEDVESALWCVPCVEAVLARARIS